MAIRLALSHVVRHEYARPAHLGPQLARSLRPPVQTPYFPLTLDQRAASP